MIRRDGYGQLDAASSAAATPAEGQSLLPFYFVAVAAGVTVFIITRLLEGKKRRK